MLVSVPLVLEYEAVLTRPEHLIASGLAEADIGTLLDALVSIGEPIRLAFLWRPMLRDANDDMVLETAVNGRPDALVTFNQRDFAEAAARFGLAVLSPRAVIKVLGDGR
jgi:predicted nucleic acid-binding protein